MYLVESLGYPKDSLAVDVSLAHNGSDPFVADLVVLRADKEQPLIVVAVSPPGSKPPRDVPAAVADSGAQYYFWFDGFIDYPGQDPSWGSRYFERGGADFEVVSNLPHHHRALRPRRRRPTTKNSCPKCSRALDQFCLVPCTDDCPGWACPWFRLLYCADCGQSFPRPRGSRPPDPNSDEPDSATAQSGP